MNYVYGTPSSSPNRKMMCPWAPNREGNSDKVIISIPFPIIDEKNRFSTPRKRRRVNPNPLRAPKKKYEGSLFESSLYDVKKVLFPDLAASLPKRIKEERIKIIKSSEYPRAPMKSAVKRKSNERDLNSIKNNLFKNKKNNFSPYSRILE